MPSTRTALIGKLHLAGRRQLRWLFAANGRHRRLAALLATLLAVGTTAGCGKSAAPPQDAVAMSNPPSAAEGEDRDADKADTSRNEPAEDTTADSAPGTADGVAGAETEQRSDEDNGTTPVETDDEQPAQWADIGAPPELAPLLQALLEDPTAETYLAAHRAVVGSKEYQPYTTAASDVMSLVKSKEFQAALDKIGEIRPNLLLSPHAHAMASAACAGIGDEPRGRLELNLARACVEGIMATGDGTEQRPFVVAYTSDEYAVLGKMGKRMGKQSLIRRDGRSFDVLEDGSGESIWFEITAMQGALMRRLSGGNRSAPKAKNSDDQ